MIRNFESEREAKLESSNLVYGSLISVSNINPYSADSHMVEENPKDQPPEPTPRRHEGVEVLAQDFGRVDDYDQNLDYVRTSMTAKAQLSQLSHEIRRLGSFEKQHSTLKVDPARSSLLVKHQHN